MSTTRVNGHTFFDKFIHKDSVVIDLGANRGVFSRLMAERFGCSCYAVEANRDVFNLFASDKRLKPFNFAAAKETGTLDFYVSENSEESSLTLVEGIPVTQKVTVPAKRLDEFAAEQSLTAIDLLKMDIEGAEIGVIDSCSDDFLRNISQLTIEFHDFNKMASQADVARVIGRLKGLGFYCFVMSRKSNMDVCFVNRARCAVSPAEALWVRYITSNVRGAMRMFFPKSGDH